MRKKTHEEYEAQLFQREIDYFPLEQYNGNHTPILHECLKDHKWQATPGHILAGHGCPYCAGNKHKTDEEYKETIKDKPLINIEPYQTDRINIKHKCLTCEHIWNPTPSMILQGTGCPMCATSSYNKNKPGIIYHVSLDYNDKIYYKIGITNKSVAERFKRDWNRLKMKIIWKISFVDGNEPLKLEKELLSKYKLEHSMKPLRGGGNTELVTHKIDCPIR